MTNAIIIILLFGILFFAFGGAKKRLKKGCCGGGSRVRIKAKDTNISNYTYKLTVYIDGMTCENCKIRIENAFNSMDGCMAKVSLKKKCATLYSKRHLSDEEVASAVEKCGYVFKKCIRE